MTGTDSISKDITVAVVTPGAMTDRDTVRMAITGAVIMQTDMTGPGCIGRKTPMERAVLLM